MSIEGDLELAIRQTTGEFDLSSAADHERVRAMADQILEVGGRSQTRCETRGDANQPLDLRLAVTLAISKQAIRDSGWSGRLAVVFAMWGESRRLRPRSDRNPTGEAALHIKLDQLAWLLAWLFAGSGCDWRLFPVDDGDPEDSATVAENQAATHAEGHRVAVLRLADAVPATSGPLVGLSHVDDSRKGGAIVYGAQVAMADGFDAVIVTDADNSVNLGQLGLLLEKNADGADVVIGDRKHPQSVLVKAEARWGPGIVVLRHMQRMVGRELFGRGIRDTQAAFKLYNRQALEGILRAPSTYGFAFDSDWLLGAIGIGKSIERVPFAFVDSFEESASITQGPMTTWESLLQGLVAAVRARGVDHDEEMALVVDRFAHASLLESVVKAVPPALQNAREEELGSRELMLPGQLWQWLEQLNSP